MRELRSRLKAAGDRFRDLTGFQGETATFLRQRAQALRDRARQWRPGSARGEANSLAQPAPLAPEDAAPPRWHNPWPQSADSAAAAAHPAADAEGEDRTEGGWQDHLPTRRSLFQFAAIGVLLFLALPYPLIVVYRVIDPPFSSLMTRQFLTGVNIQQEWVDFDDISPALPRAVVISEDAAFCRHHGVDWNAVSDAIDEAGEGNGVRGASTIPMQTAKNLFLWNGQSYIRKVLEVPLAYVMSAVWPKRRLLEIYLNIAEWGPGIFGAEAAARHHFGKSASQLTPREASLLAAALPNPIRRNAGRPSGQTARIAAHIGARAGRESQDAACVFTGRQ